MTKSILLLAHSQILHSKRWINYFVKKKWKIYLISFHPDKIRGVRNINLKVGKISPTGGNYKYLLKLFWIIYYVHRIKPEILNSHFLSSFGILGYLTFHKNHIINLYGSDIYVAPKKNKLVRIIIKKSLMRANHIISVSDDMTSLLTNKFNVDKRKITTMQYGVDISLFKNYMPLEKRQFDIISNRSFVDNSNYDLILKLIYELKNRGIKAKLLIVGQGPLKNRIIKIIQKLDLNDLVMLKDSVDQPEMVRLLNSAKIFLSLTKSDGTPLSLFEAMACGLYPILSNNFSNLEWLKKGIIATDINLENFQESINKIIKIYSRIYHLNYQRHNSDFVKKYMNYSRNMGHIESIFKNSIK